MTPVLLIGGMTTGIFTPTEGAIAACIWAMVLGFAWYRTLNWKMFVKVCLDTVETTSTVLFIVAAASIFGWMLTATGVTVAISEWVLGFTKEPWVFLLLANLLMLFVGCFLEPTAAITILVPILVPICQQLGIDLVHFGLVMVLNLMIGLLHPPMGMVLFVLARVAKLRSNAPPWPSCLGWCLCWVRWPSSPTFRSWCCGCPSSFTDDPTTLNTDMTPFIRLHPADDVLIARSNCVGGTSVEGIPCSGPDPARPQGRHARHRRRRAGAPLQPDHRFCQQADRPGEHVHTHNL
jgi:hypothetical protein